jgi:hypothetical protein
MVDNPYKPSKGEQASEAVSTGGGRSENNGIADFVAGLLPNGGSRSNDFTWSSGQKGGRRDWFDLEEIQNINPSDKGVIKLCTGDSFERANGVEKLTTKDGGSLVVKADGSYVVTGGTAKFDLKSGETTVDFGHGRSATIRDGRIDSVTDVRHTAFMNRTENEFRRNPHVVVDDDWKPEYTKPDPIQQLLNKQKLQNQLNEFTPKPYSPSYDELFGPKK